MAGLMEASLEDWLKTADDCDWWSFSYDYVVEVGMVEKTMIKANVPFVVHHIVNKEVAIVPYIHNPDDFNLNEIVNIPFEIYDHFRNPAQLSDYLKRKRRNQ